MADKRVWEAFCPQEKDYTSESWLNRAKKKKKKEKEQQREKGIDRESLKRVEEACAGTHTWQNN